MKLLIVEDDSDSRIYLERSLNAQGHTVETAVNGVEALEKVKLSAPDLIISDILMPEMDGFEFCRRIKKDEYLKTIPLIFYTATYIDQQDEDLAMSLGASRFVVKPTEMSVLLSIIKEVMDEHNKVNLPVLDTLKMGDEEISQKHRDALIKKLSKKINELEQERLEVQKKEKDLHQSEKKYRTLFENANDGILLIDPDTQQIIDCNKKAADMVGYTVEELKTKTISDLHPDKEKHLLSDKLTEIETTGSVSCISGLHHKTADGRLVPIEINATMVEYDGKLLNLSIVRDISERKKLEEQLLQSQKMEAVGQLTGGIAHDFNNILSAIIGYAYLLKVKLKKDDPSRHYSDQILSAAEKAASLIRSLLSFSRKQIISPRPVNLIEIIGRIEKLLSRLITENIELTTIYNPMPHLMDKDDLYIMADPGSIEQVIMNLTTNARDAMPNGGKLSIETRYSKIDTEFIHKHGFGVPGEYAVIRVSDIGIGMDSRTREKIFEPFFTTKGMEKGSGLGLAMVYGIITQHEGYIDVESTPGKGTTFSIYLPVAKAKGSADHHTSIPPEVTPKHGTETVLVAEDDENLRYLLKTILNKYGYTVLEAANGQEEIDSFMENKDKIHLVISDLIMPNKNGNEAYREISEMKPDTKVIFLSGNTDDVTQKSIAVENGLPFLLKPVYPDVLLAKVREVLDH